MWDFQLVWYPYVAFLVVKFLFLKTALYDGSKLKKGGFKYFEAIAIYGYNHLTQKRGIFSIMVISYTIDFYQRFEAKNHTFNSCKCIVHEI